MVFWVQKASHFGRFVDPEPQGVGQVGMEKRLPART